jgi:hypothetical protein
VCEVHADPPPRSFRWKFNSSGESYEIPKDRYFKNGSQSSILHYTPVMDQEYGTLTCSGQNDVGEQTNPCVFQVILAGKKSDFQLLFSLSTTASNIATHPLTLCQNIDDKQENFSDMKLFSFPTKSLINFSHNSSSSRKDVFGVCFLVKHQPHKKPFASMTNVFNFLSHLLH